VVSLFQAFQDLVVEVEGVFLGLVEVGVFQAVVVFLKCREELAEVGVEELELEQLVEVELVEVEVILMPLLRQLGQLKVDRQLVIIVPLVR